MTREERDAQHNKLMLEARDCLVADDTEGYYQKLKEAAQIKTGHINSAKEEHDV